MQTLWSPIRSGESGCGEDQRGDINDQDTLIEVRMSWEYKILHVERDDHISEELSETFNEFGRNGWELVKFEPVLTSGFFFLFFGWATSTESFVAVFKREIGAS